MGYKLDTKKDVKGCPTDYCERIRFRFRLPVERANFGGHFQALGLDFDVVGRRKSNCEAELNFENTEDPRKLVSLVSREIKKLPGNAIGSAVRDSFVDSFLKAYNRTPMGLYFEGSKSVELPPETIRARAYARDIRTLAEFFADLNKKKLLEDVVRND